VKPFLTMLLPLTALVGRAITIFVLSSLTVTLDFQVHEW